MALSKNRVVSHMSEYLEFLELCALDGSSKRISLAIAKHAWPAAAVHAGLSLIGVEQKTSIKAVFGAVRDHDQRSEAIFLPSSKSAQDLIKATQHMKNMTTKHLDLGGQMASSFLFKFQFEPEDVESYIADPHREVSSIPLLMSMGQNTIELTLTWRGDTMWLSADAVHATSFDPFSIQLRAVSPTLTNYAEGVHILEVQG